MSISQTIFRQYDVRGIVGTDLTDEVAYGIGRGYASLLAARGISGAVAVGRDNRPSGDALRDALVRGLTECGVDVVDVGVVPTPLLYWALHHEPVVGGIQITGSHNPPESNGFKMCLGTASLHGADIQTLYQYIVGGQHPAGHGHVRNAAVIDRYVHDIATRIGPITRPDGSPLRVVYDCGNGAGALVATQLFEALGVDGVGLFTESDGTFPNHHPDPTVPENLADCIAAVRDSGAELGVAFDGDADRIGVWLKPDLSFPVRPTHRWIYWVLAGERRVTKFGKQCLLELACEFGQRIVGGSLNDAHSTNPFFCCLYALCNLPEDFIILIFAVLVFEVDFRAGAQPHISDPFQLFNVFRVQL
jgi:phosphomannomutase